MALCLVVMSACSRDKKAAPDLKPRVETMSSSRIEVTMIADPPKVALDKDVLLTIRISAPTVIEVALPSLDDRLTGFVLNGVIDEEPAVKEGKTILERRVRLTPVLSDRYRISPIAITYADKSRNPAETGWFPTKPMVFDRGSPIDGAPPGDIEGAVEPVWIRPAARTIAMRVLVVLAAVALLFVLWKLAKRVHRQIKLMRMSPRERAMFELGELLSKDLPARGMVKEFYIELTMIVRRYIERRHAIRAPEQTTDEFLVAVSADPRFSAEVVNRLKAFLEAADLVKFAADRPEPAAIGNATDTAKDYIEKDSAVDKRKD